MGWPLDTIICVYIHIHICMYISIYIITPLCIIPIPACGSDRMKSNLSTLMHNKCSIYIYYIIYSTFHLIFSLHPSCLAWEGHSLPFSFVDLDLRRYLTEIIMESRDDSLGPRRSKINQPLSHLHKPSILGLQKSSDFRECFFCSSTQKWRKKESRGLTDLSHGKKTCSPVNSSTFSQDNTDNT